jgi:hypothetical protein
VGLALPAATAPASRACKPTGLGAITGGGGLTAGATRVPCLSEPLAKLPLPVGGDEVMSCSLNVEIVVRLDWEVMFGRLFADSV